MNQEAPMTTGFHEFTPLKGKPWIGWVYVSPHRGACVRKRGELGAREIDVRFLTRHEWRGPITAPSGVPVGMES